MAEPLAVVGGSIAALVTAHAAAARGREVELLLPAGRLGSGFLPLERDARRLDLGPRIIELGYDDAPAEPPALETYEPGPHGHRPFLALIDDLVRDLAGDDLQPISPPEITRGGVRATDFILGGDLADLPLLLSDDERNGVAQEAAERAERLGPAGVLADEEGLAELSLEAASLETHGPSFHTAVLGPLTDKVLPDGAGNVIASMRRKVWMPLFWPRSLVEACLGTLTYRPNRPMHTIAGGGMGAIVERLLARLRADPAVSVRSMPPLDALSGGRGHTVLSFADGETVEATDVVLAVGPDESFRLAGWSGRRTDRVRGVYVWLDVAREHLRDPASVLFVLDPAIPAFRVSENTGDDRPGRATLVCELVPTVSDHDAADVALAVVVQLGLVAASVPVDLVHALSGPSFAAPSFDNRARHVEGVEALRHSDLRADVIGVDAFGADSFNEQVVQGLAAAARWS